MDRSINLIKYTFICLTALSFSSCYVNLDDDGFNCDRARGPVVTEHRNLPDFNRVTNAIGADIVLRQEQDQEFLITTRESLLRDITTSVINGELVIDYRGCFRDANIEIYIATPEIEAVHNIGSGDIVGDNTWHADQMELRITGSGKIDAEINAQSLYSEITGSGTMELFGAVDQGRMRISGSGDIFAFNLDSNSQEIVISGSGNCEVLTQNILEVRISGSGDVYYRGHPQVNTSITGSGGVFNAN